jgi:hypothetical protein
MENSRQGVGIKKTREEMFRIIESSRESTFEIIKVEKILKVEKMLVKGRNRNEKKVKQHAKFQALH